MRSNGKRKSEWPDDEYARRKLAAKAWGLGAGYLASTAPQAKDGALGPQNGFNLRPSKVKVNNTTRG